MRSKHPWSKSLTRQSLERAIKSFSNPDEAFFQPTQILLPPGFVNKGKRHKYLWRVKSLVSGYGNRENL